MKEFRDDKDFVLLGIAVTFGLHVLVFGGFALASHLDGTIRVADMKRTT